MPHKTAQTTLGDTAHVGWYPPEIIMALSQEGVHFFFNGDLQHHLRTLAD